MLNYGILLREREGDFQKSADVFARGSRVFPDYTAFLKERAGSLLVMQDYESMFAVAQAMAKYPDRQYEALVYSGIYYNDKGLTDAALNAFSKAIEVNPRSYATRFNRATIYKQLKNWDAMGADLSEAIRLNRDYADAYAERGNLYAHLGHLDEALSDYGKYVSLRPEDASGFYYRGQVLCLLGRKVEGSNDLHKAVEMGFPDARAKRRQLSN
jgi:tetratricopeptide (TPR) repeat protein